MHCPVFGRIRRSDNDLGLEESGIPDRHPCLNAVLLGLNGWRNHAAVGAVICRNDQGFAPKQGIGLLLNGGKAGIEVNVHDQWLVAVNG
jgi:hypothetical protein